MSRESDARDGSTTYEETRWPMAAAVAVSMVLTFLLPDSLRLGAPWMLPVLSGVLVAALLAGDPGSISRRTTWLRAGSIALIVVLSVGAVWSTVQLVDDIVSDGRQTSSATQLLEAGANVWTGTVIACALLYFELDCGGSAARAERMPRSPDLAFPQQLNPDIAPEGWRPLFLDYLYLGLTNATAFSPTDVMPLARWAKAIMSVQAVISLVITGLVVARAVNVLQ